MDSFPKEALKKISESSIDSFIQVVFLTMLRLYISVLLFLEICSYFVIEILSIISSRQLCFLFEAVKISQ